MESKKFFDVCLVSMPVADLIPSMALSLLKSCLNRAKIKSIVCYENLFYVQHCGLERYRHLKFSRYEFLMGEIIFSKTAHGKPLLSLSQYLDWMKNIRLPVGGINPEELESANFWINHLEEQQTNAENFIQESAERILQYQPRIVAFVSMFQQTNATIAVARRLKMEKNPPLILVGGANCTGDLGAALLEYVNVFDYVFTGEADDIFANVCSSLLKNGSILPENLPNGVLSRQSPSQKKIIGRVTKNIEILPIPDFHDFFSTYEKLFSNKHAPFLLEGSRGCWWGEKKPCTFCGLNGHLKGYREKNTEQLVKEIEYLVQEHPSAEICILTDNILSRKQIKELPAALSQRKIKLKFSAEIKSNITEEDIRSLAKIGFFQLQPGIESLQDDLLEIMNKGCRAIKQIETLKFCNMYNIFVAWNLLCGFPGEKEKYYTELANLLPKIMHLPPPIKFNHIRFQRFSEYVEKTNYYGLLLRTARVYDFAFADKDFINRLAYFFEPVDDEELYNYWNISKKGDAYQRVYNFVKLWQNKSQKPQLLYMRDSIESILIYDTRIIARHKFYQLKGLYAEIYRICRSVKKKDFLLKILSPINCEKELFYILEYLCQENLMVNINDEYLSLAIELEN